MQFRDSQPIYLQIAEFVCEKILLKEWPPGERIPSVRELAVLLEVNANTILRTYEFLEQKSIIFNQRGIGFFAAKDALAQATRYRKELFIEKDLPQVFRSLFLLDMGLDELKAGYEKFKKQISREISK
ncbi:MAG TPA: GntR family transcriptional regulator [Puia sp.]|nr:GntR family transcriptional regulator [Puia sp.]